MQKKQLKVWNSIDEFSPSGKTVVTLGTFDGVHLGHRKILQRLKTQGDLNDRESVVLTFFPHPRTVLDAEKEVFLLNNMDEKIALLEECGIDNLIIHPFDKSFSQLSASEFVEQVLVNKLNVGKIVIGHDHRFGKGRSANIDDLIHFGKLYNFEVEQISPQDVDEVTISSTKIRKALTNGNIVLANQYLGYKYILTGKIEKGKMLGRKLGYPTANIAVADPYKLIPKDGVYAVTAKVDDTMYKGMLNIGNNPTFEGSQKTIEVNLFDFEREIYGETIQINLHQRLRDEYKFDSVEALKDQLNKDKIAAISVL